MTLYASEPFVSEENTLTVDTSRWLDWCKLCRLPNVFTAMADPLAGALLIGVGWDAAPLVILLMFASACFYAGGIILNDWHDYKLDLKERPERPLPSGRIGRFRALFVALLLLVVGVFFASLVSKPATVVAGLLLASIVAYDIILKEVPIAPAVMGLCRALNLALGMSLATENPITHADVQIALACMLWLYVTGVTAFARKEYDPKDKTLLVVGSIMVGVAILSLMSMASLLEDQLTNTEGLIWAALLAGVVGNRMIVALINSEPAKVKSAVKTGVLGIIVFDAAMIAYAQGLAASLPVVVLLIPAVYLGRKMYST